MDPLNPYQAPAAALAEALPRLDIVSAGRWRRFFNWAIDKLVIYGLVFVGMIVAMLVWGEPAVAWAEDISTLADYVITAVVFLLYYTVMEGLFGFSIGKLITNTRVVDEYGQRLSMGRSCLRSLCRLIPFDALSLLFSDDQVRRAWHDSISRSYVVVRPRAGQPVAPPRRSLQGEFADGFFPKPVHASKVADASEPAAG